MKQLLRILFFIAIVVVTITFAIRGRDEGPSDDSDLQITRIAIPPAENAKSL